MLSCYNLTAGGNMNFDYKKHFPYDEVRPAQDKAIQFALDSFVNKNKRFVIIEAGTGVGKSAIGLTIANYLGGGAYFLTTQKVLQAQYMRDFKSEGLRSLTSSTNFRCQYYKTKDCSSALRELKISKDQRFKACCGGGCVYKKAKGDFINAELGTTNFPYFMAETNYSAQLTPRKLLVIDECHNVEIQLGNFVSIEISEHFAESILKLKVPELKTMYQVVNWVKSDYLPRLGRIKAHMENQIEKFSLGTKLKEFVAVSKRYELIDKHLCKLNRFIAVYNKDNWVMNEITTEGRSKRKWEFKPIDIAPFSEDNLFKSGEKILLMSATIMDKDAFCQILGINPKEAAFISIPSPFKKENRPIIYAPVAKMGMRDIDASLPKIAEAVKAILEQHKNEKGIIHCHSYKVTKFLKENIRNKRLLTHDAENRDKILAKHQADPRPTVLLSPSMTEGVDLKGDASRFQIICKIPYPYLGDKLVKKRMNKWSWWYPLQTAKVVVQSVGRSIRNEEDHAVTYILDAGWDYFLKKNKSIFPKEFLESLT